MSYLIERTLQLQSHVELGQLCQDDPVNPCALIWNTSTLICYFSQTQITHSPTQTIHGNPVQVCDRMFYLAAAGGRNC